MQYRSVFISDIHLGSADVQTEALLAFLKQNQFQHLYCVGDIIDFWALKRSTKWWKPSHNMVIQKLMRQRRQGSKSYYVWGNHDEASANFDGEDFGGIVVCERVIHTTIDGKKYLVMHGHQLDAVMRVAPWLAHLGSWAYDVCLWVNKHYNGLRKLMGLKYWSLSQWLKLSVKSAVNFVGDFEKGIVDFAKEAKTDGVICGHIHCAADRMFGDVHYLNCGDWVESCTCVVEHLDGRMEVVRFNP